MSEVSNGARSVRLRRSFIDARKRALSDISRRDGERLLVGLRATDIPLGSDGPAPLLQALLKFASG